MVVGNESNYADREGWLLVGVIAIFDKPDGGESRSESVMNSIQGEQAGRVAKELRRLADVSDREWK